MVEFFTNCLFFLNIIVGFYKVSAFSMFPNIVCYLIYCCPCLLFMVDDCCSVRHDVIIISSSIRMPYLLLHIDDFVHIQ